MPKVEEQAARTNLWTALIERSLKVLEWIGLSVTPRDVVITVLGALGYTWAVVREGLPWYVILPLVIFLVGAGLHFFAGVARALAVRGLKKLDIAALARDCASFRDDLLRFLVERADQLRVDRIPRGGGDAVRQAMEDDWARRADHNNQTRARLVERFSGRIVALNQMFRTAGIAPADTWAFDHGAAGIAAYVGAVGDLLERGLLKEARQLDPKLHRDFHI